MVGGEREFDLLNFLRDMHERDGNLCAEGGGEAGAVRAVGCG